MKTAVKEFWFAGKHPNQSMTIREFRSELRRLRKLYADIDQWEYWYDGGAGTATWDGKTTVAAAMKQLRGAHPEAVLMVEEQDGWQGPSQGFRYIPEERCVIIDYDICIGGINDDE